jgi:hypothetical protein
METVRGFSTLRGRSRRLFRQLWRRQGSGALIRALLAEQMPSLQRQLVYVETGRGGDSTRGLAEVARRTGAVCYSCGSEPDEAARAELPEVSFLAGETLESLARIAARHEHVDFALFDSAPSALHTLREFQQLEPRLGPGARVLIGSAALPGARLVLGPCRKGKLLVPYLLASPVWQVTAHPRTADSMVSALHDRVGARADAKYEDPAYTAALDRALHPSR